MSVPVNIAYGNHKPISDRTGQLDNWTTGQIELDNWTTGQRTGQLDNWTTGQLDNWTTGQLDNWTTGQLDNWINDATIQGHNKQANERTNNQGRNKQITQQSTRILLWRISSTYGFW